MIIKLIKSIKQLYLQKIKKQINMCKQLVISEKDAIRLYPSADKAMKELFELNFGKDFFNRDITDRIKNMSDVYSDMGINEKKFYSNLQYRTEKTNELALKIGFEKEELGDYPCFPIRDFEIFAIIFVLNEGWIPTKDQRRWTPYFSCSGSSGFGFSSAVYDYDYVGANGGFRLCLKSEKLAKHSGVYFAPQYKKHFCIK